MKSGYQVSKILIIKSNQSNHAIWILKRKDAIKEITISGRGPRVTPPQLLRLARYKMSPEPEGLVADRQ